MYGVEPIFWMKVIVVVAVMATLSVVFNTVMRKYLKIEKRKAFSYDHMSEKHKKIDWIIRISFVIILITKHFFITRNLTESIWYLETWFLLLVYIVVSEIIRAFMQWKYAENRKAYIFTISQLIFLLVIMLLMMLYISFSNVF